MTHRSPGKAAQQIFILNLIFIRVHPLEKLVDTYNGILLSISLVSIPNQVFNFLRQITIRLKYRYPVLIRHAHQTILEPTHFFAPPARYRPIVNALRLVWHHQILADADNLPKPAADRTRSEEHTSELQ